MKVNLLTWQSDLTSGGIQNTSFLLAKEMSKTLGEDFILFEESNSAFQENINTVRMQYKGWWRYYFEMIRFLRRERKPDFNLCMLWMCGISAYIYKLMYKKPYGVMVYGNDIIEAKQVTVKRKIKNWIRKMVLDNADIIFACSNYSLDICKIITSNRNLKVVFPPVYITKEAGPYNANGGRHLLFSIGRHVERKGFQDVIRAISELKLKYPDIEYHLAGDGPYNAVLKQIAKEEGVEDHIRFLGRISEEQKIKEFQNCSIFIMTSHEEIDNMEVEGFGIVYIEANMYGKWVIACDNGGVSDAVISGKTGTLIDTPNPKQIANAIEDFFSKEVEYNPVRLFEWAKRFSPKNISNQYLHSIEEILGRPSKNLTGHNRVSG